jgi:hypothetical protein
MIAAELAQRSFVELKKNLAQCQGFRIPGGETLPINLTQGVDGRVAVFVADFTVVVAVAIVETCVAHHGALRCAYSSESILLPRPNGNLAPQPEPASPEGGLAQRVRARRGPMTGSGVIHHVLLSSRTQGGGLRFR